MAWRGRKKGGRGRGGEGEREGRREGGRKKGMEGWREGEAALMSSSTHSYLFLPGGLAAFKSLPINTLISPLPPPPPPYLQPLCLASSSLPSPPLLRRERLPYSLPCPHPHRRRSHFHCGGVRYRLLRRRRRCARRGFFVTCGQRRRWRAPTNTAATDIDDYAAAAVAATLPIELTAPSPPPPSSSS